MTQLGPHVDYIPNGGKRVSSLEADGLLTPYLIGSPYPAPGACSPFWIRQSSRMVGPPVTV